MGFQLKDPKGLNSEINVTPLVDVMLVLLIIFMISAPMMFNGINLELPKTKKVARVNLGKGQVILSVSRTGELFIGNEKFLRVELVKKIASEFKKTGNDVVYLRAHYALKYGEVAKLISYLKMNGLNKLSLVTEVDDKAP